MFLFIYCPLRFIFLSKSLFLSGSGEVLIVQLCAGHKNRWSDAACLQTVISCCCLLCLHPVDTSLRLQHKQLRRKSLSHILSPKVTQLYSRWWHRPKGISQFFSEETHKRAFSWASVLSESSGVTEPVPTTSLTTTYKWLKESERCWLSGTALLCLRY